MPTEQKVMQLLSTIDDPELRKPLTELGMVKSVSIENEVVNIAISLTVPGCPLKDKISGDIVTAVESLKDVSKVKVAFDVMSEQQREELKKKLGFGSSEESLTAFRHAKRCIAVASGKGGVGKSTVTTNLASAFAKLGFRVGILDADVYGFSIPRMIGVAGEPKVIGDKMVPIQNKEHIQVLSMGFFVDEDQPIIWRGPMLHKAIEQFVNDVLWDDLDYLFIDLPPGTGDITLTIAQAMPTTELLLVTTPQEAATHVAGRVAQLARQTKLRVIGVVENMSYYAVGEQKEYIFGKDGGKQLADALSVPLLGNIPLSQRIREGCDSGKPIACEGNTDEIGMWEKLALDVKQAAAS